MNYKKISLSIIVFIALCSLVALYIAKDIKFNYSIESYFPKDNKEVEFYNQFSKDFERDIDFILIGIENKDGVFNTEFLTKIKNLSEDLKLEKDVLKVVSPTSLKSMVNTPMGFSEVKIVHIGDNDRLKKDSIKIYKEKEWVGTYFSKQGSIVNVIVTTTPKINKENGAILLAKVRENVEKRHFDSYKVAGTLRTQEYYIKQMGEEFILFSSLSVVLLVFYLLFIYRAFWTIWVSAIVIGLSILWTIAIIIFIEGKMNMLLSMLPILLFVIGISDVIHIITKYVEELRNGLEKTEAIIITIKEVGLATFLTSFTTAMGFLSLMTSNSPPIREFGVYVAIGVMISYFISILLLPSLLFLFRAPKIGIINHSKPSFWNTQVRNAMYWLFGNKLKIIVITVVLVVVSTLGLFNLNVNNYFLDDLNVKSELKQDLLFFENNFNGIRPFEVAISTTNTSATIIDFEVIKELVKIESYLKSNYELGTVFSPLEIIRKSNKAMHTGNHAYYVIPNNKAEYNKLISTLKKYEVFKKSKGLITSDFSKCRISSKIKDTGSANLRLKNEQFYTFMSTEISPKINARITGMPHLLDTTNSYITRNLVGGLALAIFVIALTIGVMFKSIKIVIISLIPNIIPLVAIAGIMGFFDMDLKISTGIVFTIAFGIAVDDTIHFLSKFKIELAKGKTVPYAVKRTFISSGKAIVLTSLVLSSGFVSFTLSDFESTVLIGLLICITLLIAVLADLFLLPLLILKYYKK